MLHPGLSSLLSLVRSLKINTTTARDRLSATAAKIFEDQYLLDDSKKRPKTFNL